MWNSPNQAELCKDVRGRHPPPAHTNTGILTQTKIHFFEEKRVKKEALIHYL